MLGQAPRLTPHDSVINDRKPGATKKSKCCARACPGGLTRAAVPAQPARQPRLPTTTIECEDAARPDPATISSLPTRAEGPTLKPWLCSAEPRTTARVLMCGAMRCQGRARSRDVALDPDWRTYWAMLTRDREHALDDAGRLSRAWVWPAYGLGRADRISPARLSSNRTRVCLPATVIGLPEAVGGVGGGVVAPSMADRRLDRLLAICAMRARPATPARGGRHRPFSGLS